MFELTSDAWFSQRNANSGWGEKGTGRGNGGGSWKHDQFDGSMKEAGRRMGIGERDEKPRGVCYAFQRGECNRGDACKFAHDEQVGFSAHSSTIHLLAPASHNFCVQSTLYKC